MTASAELALRYVPNFLLILLRASIFLSLLPFFGSQNFPVMFKIGFVVAISLVLTPVVELQVSRPELPLLIMRELILGAALGLTARFAFLVVDMAGQLASYSMGLSVGSVFNPEFGQSTELAQLFGIMAMLVFLSMDAHHELIYVFVKSYEWIPAGGVSLPTLLPAIIVLGSNMFVLALKLSAPVLVVMLVSNLLLGFMNKAAPQMNVFFAGFPVYMFVGFTVLIIGVPVLVQTMSSYFGALPDELMRMLNLAKG